MKVVTFDLVCVMHTQLVESMTEFNRKSVVKFNILYEHVSNFLIFSLLSRLETLFISIMKVVTFDLNFLTYKVVK